jgi:hypothetical protein
MAVKIAIANGNLTAAATWGAVDATSLLDSEAASTVLTTAYVETATFTPGAITIDGIAVKIATRPGATGTIDVRLAQAGATVAGTAVSINVSDIEARDGEQGWYFFKFAAPVLLVAATLYTVSAKTTNATQVFLFRNATAGNWSRMLRTTTTGAPAAGDSMHILGEWTAAATVTTRTVTMDQTAATDYGDGVAANPPGFTIGKNGVLTWGTTAATNYILQLSTRLFVYRGGIYNQGTTATPCPRDGSQVMQFDCVADGDFGLTNYGTRVCQGLSRTIAKNVVQCLMNADKAALATVIGVDTDTGWLNGDEVAIAPTARTTTQGETRVLTGAAGATTFTVTVGLTNAHSGTSPTAAKVILLTRNVRIRSVSTTAMAYVYDGNAAIVDADWVEYRFLGAATAGKQGVYMDTTSAGSTAHSFCSFRDFEVGGLWAANNDADNFSADNCVMWNCAQDNGGVGFFVNSQTQTAFNWSLTTCTSINNGATNGYGFSTRNLAGSVTGLNASGSSAAGLRLEPINTVYGRSRATVPWSTLEFNTNTVGIEVNNVDEWIAGAVTLWRNVTAGVSLVSTCTVVFNTATIFGNGLGITLNGAANGYKWLKVRTGVFSGDTSFAQISGITLVPGATVPCQIDLENCTFGVVSGIKTAHTQDIDVGTGQKVAWINLRNVNLASATPIASQANLRPPSYIRYQRVQQASNTHKTVLPVRGTIAYETTTFRTASPSESLTPLSTQLKLETAPKRVPVLSGSSVSVAAYARKNAAYNGNAARLMQRANPAIGVLVDTLIATFSAAADTWQQLSGVTALATENGVCEFYVDCDGTAGSVFVDDWTAV